MTLGVETHRIEVTSIETVTTDRRAQKGMQVTYLVHADDTGKDTRSNAALLEKAATVETAMVAGMSTFTAAAQTNDAAVGALTGDDFQNVARSQHFCQEAVCQVEEPLNANK